MSEIARRSRNAIAFAAIVFLGTFLSFGLYHVWDLETRWMFVIFVGIAAVGVSLCFARRFSDLILIGTFFSIPFATFTKWLYTANLYSELEQGALIGTLGIGIVDFLIVGLYMTWFYRIFIIRVEEPPHLQLLDGLVLCYVAAYFVASIGAWSRFASYGGTEFLLKHALLYFYVSRHVEERHVPWILAAFAFIVAIETPLAVYQFYSGKLLGLALDKGAGGNELNTQYHVPGVETWRAAGTSYDSHMLADYLGALLPFALVLLFTPRLRPILKFVCLVASGAALLTVVMTQSRTGWVSTAAGLSVGVILILVLWRERQVLPALAGLLLLAALMAPFVGNFIYERFHNSPQETITTRFDEFKVAWYIFTQHPLFGVGPANYIHALKTYDYIGMVEIDPATGDFRPELLPVHNGILLHLAEVGIFGLLAFFAILINVAWRLFSIVRVRRDIPGRLALAALLGVTTIELNDQFIVGLHQPEVFITFWLMVALSVALPRMPRGAAAFLLAPPPRPAPPMIAEPATGRSS
jgi:O-Antigen ligase